MRRFSLPALLSLAFVVPAAAQQQALPVEPGFTPDPIRQSGRTHGTRPLRELAPGCAGFVGNAPDQVIELEGRFAFLRFFVVAPQPVSFALRGPDGHWTCVAARRTEGAAPRTEGRFEPGRYQVWVGSAERGQQIRYELRMTEFHSVDEVSGRGDSSSSATGADLGLAVDAEEGRFRDRRMRRGFLPDPREDGGEASGSVDIGLLGPGCRGFVEAAPNHILTLRDDFDYFRVQLGNVSSAASIAIRRPDGTFLCSSPRETNAFVDQETWPEGVYGIWVATHDREAQAAPYRICYTEVRPAAGSDACGGD